MSEIDSLRILCRKLLLELYVRIEDKSDSSLPEWSREAEKLGVEPIFNDDLPAT